jgi:hypothetical protein
VCVCVCDCRNRLAGLKFVDSLCKATMSMPDWKKDLLEKRKSGARSWYGSKGSFISCFASHPHQSVLMED